MNYLKIIADWLFPWRAHRHITIRSAFPLLVTLTAVFGLTASLTSEHTKILIEVDKERFYQDEQIVIDVYIVATVAVNAVNIAVAIPEQLKVESIDTGNSVITLWTEPPSFKNGLVRLSGGTYRRGFIGKHKIATIKARAVTTGVAFVALQQQEAYAGDGTGNPIVLDSASLNSVQLYLLDGKPDNITEYTIDGRIAIGVMGDLDNDGKVTLADISIFMSNWQSKSSIIDFNGDGRMSFRDFSIILSRFFFQ